MEQNLKIKIKTGPKSRLASAGVLKGELKYTTDTKEMFIGDGTSNVRLSSTIIETTYAALKALRDAGGLTPGQQYRITDYVTTTVQANTQSAGNAFDLIVVADSANKLNEQARAIKRDGDIYFTSYGAKLEAWQVWYSLDNDPDRFAWADEEDGKGVIYRLIDEFNNDVPYDFKNIQFTRKLTDGALDLVDGIDTWVYTFTGFSNENNTMVDGTTLKASEYFTDEGSNLYKNNIIGIYEVKRFEEDGFDNILETLSDNVFIGRYNEIPYVEDGPAKSVLFSFNNNLGRDCKSNTFEYGCYSNTLGNGCQYITFGHNCFKNTFGDYCNTNTFGNGCSSNTFGNNYHSNTFGNNCYNNTFVEGCYNNTFGNNCQSNTFGNGCQANTLGAGCYNNTFGNNCSSNTFGNNCQSNTFGNGCFYNTFKDFCRYITFGNSCQYNTFGNSCQYNKITGDSVQYINVDSGIQGASSANKLELYELAIDSKVYQISFKKSASGRYLMLWAIDNGTMTGKYKALNTDATWTSL